MDSASWGVTDAQKPRRSLPRLQLRLHAAYADVGKDVLRQVRARAVRLELGHIGGPASSARLLEIRACILAWTRVVGGPARRKAVRIPVPDPLGDAPRHVLDTVEGR